MAPLLPARRAGERKRSASYSRGIGQECPARCEGNCGESGPVLRGPSSEVARPFTRPAGGLAALRHPPTRVPGRGKDARPRPVLEKNPEAPAVEAVSETFSRLVPGIPWK